MSQEYCLEIKYVDLIYGASDRLFAKLSLLMDRLRGIILKYTGWEILKHELDSIKNIYRIYFYKEGTLELIALLPLIMSFLKAFFISLGAGIIAWKVTDVLKQKEITKQEVAVADTISEVQASEELTAEQKTEIIKSLTGAFTREEAEEKSELSKDIKHIVLAVSIAGIVIATFSFIKSVRK